MSNHTAPASRSFLSGGASDITNRILREAGITGGVKELREREAALAAEREAQPEIDNSGGQRPADTGVTVSIDTGTQAPPTGTERSNGNTGLWIGVGVLTIAAVGLAVWASRN